MTLNDNEKNSLIQYRLDEAEETVFGQILFKYKFNQYTFIIFVFVPVEL